MKVERTRNATRNAIFGVIYKIYVMLVPFVMRTLMIYIMGVNYLGLNSLFMSVLQMLNLAESGVGSAMVFSMYKPIAEGDGKKICALMRLYKIYYRVIGTIVLIGGIIITPFLKYLIKSDLPADINLYILFYLNLASTISTYWLFSYKNCLLFAHQRSDVSTKISIITETCKYILQIFSIVCLKNYYAYTVVIILMQIITNIVTAKVSDQMYPAYKAQGNMPKEEVREINIKIKDLFLTKIGTAIFNSADTLVISSFLGLTVLAVYQNYYFIVISITGVINIIYTSCTAGIGNSLILETEEKNYRDLNKFTLLIVWIAGFCTICLLCLFQPFMKLWVGEKLMLNFSAIIFFCIFFYVNQVHAILDLYKDAAGMWHEDRFRPFTVAMINLILNIILVNVIGVYGVLLASCIAKVFVGIPWVIRNLFKVVFHRNCLDYVKNIFKYAVQVAFVSMVIYYCCTKIPAVGIVEIVMRLLICVVGGNLLFIILWKRDSLFKDVIMIIQNLLPEKLKKILYPLLKWI